MNSVFIHIPKTGGTSISHLVGASPPGGYHQTALQLREHFSDWDQRFTFAFVRNPWARLVSFRNGKEKIIRGHSHLLPFEDFLRNTQTPLWKNSYYGRTQLDFICDKHGNQLVNFVGRFERLREDWEFVANKLNLPRELPHINKGKTAAYRDYYTDDTREFVRVNYSQEIEMFGYEF